MKNILKASLASLALALPAGAAEICDFSLNPEARDGHTPADTNRYFTVCASKRYEAHSSSVMLPDGKTIIAFWDFWQGGPCGPAAISKDAGRTWTRLDDRIPKEFGECHEYPKVFRFVDPKTGKGRIRVFASYGTADEFDWRGADDRPLAEAMPSVMSEDDGETWKFLPPLGVDFTCVAGFSGMVRLNDGTYLGVYSRGSNPNGDGGEYRIMGSYSRDGGVTFEKPFEIMHKQGRRFYMPMLFRSPDGKEICCLAWDWNTSSAYALFSRDESRTWSEPAKTRGELRGFEHSVGILPDGRFIAAFHRDGEILGWLASYEALHSRKADGFDVRFAHNYGGWSEAGTPNVHVRPDGEIVVIAHSQMDLHRPMPFVFSMKFTAEEVEHTIAEHEKANEDFEAWNPFAGSKFKPLTVARFYGPFPLEIVRNKHEKFNFVFEQYNGTKGYINKVAGSKYQQIVSKTGCFEVAKYMNRMCGDAAIFVWPITVEKDCKVRLRLIGAPSARCYVGNRFALPGVCATIFEPRTAVVELKKGENEISAMIYQPKDRKAAEAGCSNKPMLIAAGLELDKFTCVRENNLSFDVEEEITIDSEMEADE